uniref:hypothetical protein n=1 Tax=Streptomyces sp. WAC05950 TaxID=2487419 RepID=UPI0011E4CA70
MIWTASQDTLPPVPPARRLDPSPEVLAETVELTAAHLASRAHTVAVAVGVPYQPVEGALEVRHRVCA